MSQSSSTNLDDDSRMVDDISETNELAEFRSYSIRDILFVTTLTAVLVFCVIPFNGLVSTAALSLWVVLVLTEITFLAAVIRYLSKRRRRLLQLCGTKWGTGIVSELRWKGWPHLKTWLSLIFIAALSFSCNLYLTWMVNSAATGAVPLVSIVSTLQFIFIIPLYLFVVAKLICGVWWRVYPSTIEFFENGICNFARWYEWKDVEVRQSAIYKDRIVAVFVPLPPFDWQIKQKHLATMPRQQHVIRLDADLKARILDACSQQLSST